LPAWAFDGIDPGRLLAHLTLYAEPASPAGSRCDPWDASRQVPLPSAYPGGHPHDTLHGHLVVLLVAPIAAEQDTNAYLWITRDHSLSDTHIFIQNIFNFM
jgi:hypothetical protein